MSESNHFYLRAKLFLINHFGRDYQFGCGHTTKLVGKLKAFGEENIYDLGEKRDYCHQCLARMYIQCFLCKKTIMVGDGVTLIIPKEDDFQIPDHAVVYDRNPLQLVACFRHSDSFMDLAGIWMPSGKIKPFVFSGI